MRNSLNDEAMHDNQSEAGMRHTPLPDAVGHDAPQHEAARRGEVANNPGMFYEVASNSVPLDVALCDAMSNSVPCDTAPCDAIVRDGTPRDAMPSDGMTHDAVPRDGMSHDAVPRDAAPPRDAMMRDGSPRVAMMRDGVPRVAMVQDGPTGVRMHASSEREPGSGCVSSWDGEAKRPLVSRFAPSPTGRMHAGNIYASLVAWLLAKSSGGEVVLRIEDLDRERSKERYIDQVQRDYEALGLTWDRGPYFQHDRDEAYATAFNSLRERGLLYECFCTRADLHAASAPHRGEKLVYPGTCRNLTEGQRREKRRVRKPAIRLRVPDRVLGLDDLVQGPYSQDLERECGDFIVRRSDGEFAYQLAVVVDDAAQGVTCVARGVDLLCSTPQQLYLQQLLGFPHPRYAHVPLLVAREGRRLSKRDRDAALDSLLDTYKTPAGVIGHIAKITGLTDTDEPATPDELLKTFDRRRLTTCFADKVQILWR